MCLTDAYARFWREHPRSYLRYFLNPKLPQVFPANRTLRSNANSRGDLWVLYDASIPASP